MKRINYNVCETKLDRKVASIINQHAPDYENGVQEYINDVMYGGCVSGIVGELIYYTDTVKFFRRHRNDINDMLKQTIEDCGTSPAELFGDKWDQDDPLAMDTMNQNLLAWFAFEETAKKLADKLEIEV